MRRRRPPSSRSSLLTLDVRALGLVVVVVVAVAGLAAGCGGGRPPAHFSGRVFVQGDERFKVGTLHPSWRRVQAPTGDLAWFHEPTKAILATNATCHGHKDPPLAVLVNDLLLGTTDRKILLEETTFLEGREARHLVVAASLDGVPRVYDLYVVKKDGCVYDLALIAPPRAYDLVADEFVTFVAHFRAMGRRR